MNTDKNNTQLPQSSVRQRALSWWNNLSSLRKTQLCDTNEDILIKGIPRRWEKLTGREIERIFNKEYSLYFEDCRNEKCVYNVARNCKCSHIGSTCSVHVA